MRALVAMPLQRAYEFAAANGLQAEADNIRRDTQVHPGFRKGSQVRKADILDLFESQNILATFFAAHWPFGATDRGRERRDSYNKDRERNGSLLAAHVLADDEPSTGESHGAEEQEFPLEADLRDFLAHNLSAIEPGLRLYRDAERTGIEFSIDGGHGRIDVLAVDAGGTPVVIELKLSRGRNQTIGQLLYYMGWIDQHLGRGRSRGIIVAKEIPEDLVLAVRRLPEVALFRYKIAMVVEAVRSSGTASESEG